MEKINYPGEPPDKQQPLKCKGCIWGKWEAPVQFCSKQLCVNPDGGVSK